ncbi:hypothetical protein B7H23_05205 [Notoacmeibacter marinus]|uniref:Uncharacterized protein n=1 Tax=Notoacmeibacter marinus TaxID=1876515 RepID=A0A231V2D3_9HYPH|nr:hypothetical protein [Notoacmeibacter marinus]OXT02304.1 hypothetical protein B7H23_05205 [Notoacmeibacter marinus]
MSDIQKDTIDRKPGEDGDVETATGQPKKPAIHVTDAPDADAHGSAAANVIADAEAGAEPNDTAGAEPIKNMPEDYAEGKDAAKSGK